MFFQPGWFSLKQIFFRQPDDEWRRRTLEQNFEGQPMCHCLWNSPLSLSRSVWPYLGPGLAPVPPWFQPQPIRVWFYSVSSSASGPDLLALVLVFTIVLFQYWSGSGLLAPDWDLIQFLGRAVETWIWPQIEPGPGLESGLFQTLCACGPLVFCFLIW